MRYLFFGLLTVLYNFSHAREWDIYNHPNNFEIQKQEQKFELQDRSIIQKKEINFNKRGWSGYHWPYNKGSLTFRPPTQKLNPLQKWSQAQGLFDLSNYVESHLTEKEEENWDWGGFCDGYTASSLNFPEPRDKVINGVKFRSSDIKAYLTVYYNYLRKQEDIKGEYRIKRASIGQRCEVEDLNAEKIGEVIETIGSTCNGGDANAGAFHLALKKRVHKDGAGFIFDNYRYHQVWNSPIVGYETKSLGEYLQDNSSIIALEKSLKLHLQQAQSEINKLKRKKEKNGFLKSIEYRKIKNAEYFIKKNANSSLDQYAKYSNFSPQTHKTYHIQTKIYYLGYQKPQVDTYKPGKDSQFIKEKNYEYTLEVDKDGYIVGGEWITLNHPDFIWYASSIPEPSGQWSLLKQLLQ